MIKADNTGLRYDAGKPPMHLLPWDALLELAHIYGRGAQKYAPRNWEKGMDYSRVYDSLMRHAAAWNTGEDTDRESGQHHMLHVAWNALALFTYHLRGIGIDNRYKVASANEVPASSVVEIKPGLQFRTEKGSSLIWEITELMRGGFTSDGLLQRFYVKRADALDSDFQAIMSARSIAEIVRPTPEPTSLRCIHCSDDALPGKETCADCTVD